MRANERDANLAYSYVICLKYDVDIFLSCVTEHLLLSYKDTHLLQAWANRTYNEN